jgi:hypothetical protein
MSSTRTAPRRTLMVRHLLFAKIFYAPEDHRVDLAGYAPPVDAMHIHIEDTSSAEVKRQPPSPAARRNLIARRPVCHSNGWDKGRCRSENEWAHAEMLEVRLLRRSIRPSGLALICRTIDTHVVHPHGRPFHCRPSSLVPFCQPAGVCKWSPTPCQEDPYLLVFVRSGQSLALLGRRTSSSARRPSYVGYEEEYIFPIKPARGCISARRASTRTNLVTDVDGYSSIMAAPWWQRYFIVCNKRKTKKVAHTETSRRSDRLREYPKM